MKDTPVLSVIVPAYNEERTIGAMLRRLFAAVRPLGDVQVIVVDDGSRDRTRKELRPFEDRTLLISHERNLGKAAAIRTGLAQATGDYTLIQDADLEYHPEDIPKLLEAARATGAPAVFGSRNLNPRNRRSSFFFHLGGLLVTWIADLLYGLRLTDEATGYKLVRTDVFKSMGIETDGFELCPEMTAKLALGGHRIVEVPISYSPRSRAEGKKIRARDGWIAIRTLLAYRFGAGGKRV